MQLFQILLLALLCSLSIFMHILACALWQNWFPAITCAPPLLVPRVPLTHHLHRAARPTARSRTASAARAGLGYLLAPLPIALYNMSSGDSLLSESNKSGQHWAEFFSTFLISLVVGTPFVMMHTGLIASGAVFMTLSGFVLAVATVALLAFFSRAEAQDDGGMFG